MLHHLVGGLHGRFGVEIRKWMAFGVLHEMDSVGEWAFVKTIPQAVIGCKTTPCPFSLSSIHRYLMFYCSGF